MKDAKTAIIRFSQPNDQTLGEIRKISGFIKLSNFIDIINVLDLEANPRASKVGKVTNEIQDSIVSTPDLLPFKTKGVLLAAADYEELERNRWRLTFIDPTTEGILDGGHNTLAFGLYILKNSFDLAGEKFPKKIISWNDFKKCWNDNHLLVEAYRDSLRDEKADDLNTLVPVELLLPADPDDYEIESNFRSNLLDICAARNNNVELSVGTKANKKGYFDSLKRIIGQKDPELNKRIEWKLNDGGDIKVESVIALTWIPLSLLKPVFDENKRKVEPPSANSLYSSKGICLKSFERLMSSPDVTIETEKDYIHELKSPSVAQAFNVAADIPSLFDYIYEVFPELYNKCGKKYGRISSVKALNSKKKAKMTPFGLKEISMLSPDGFIMPLVYGLQALMEVKEENGIQSIAWKVDDPKAWLEDNLEGIVRRYSDILVPWNYDPQKVGKALQSYNQALDFYKMALMGI